MDKFSSETKNNLNQLILILDKAYTVGKIALDKFPTSEYELDEFIHINLLERFVFHIQSINILLKHFHVNTAVEPSIGLIIRTSLLDFISLTYLNSYRINISSETDRVNIDEYEKQVKGLLTDSVKHGLKYIKYTKDSNLISVADYKQSIESMWHTYSKLFLSGVIDYEHPEKQLISDLRISPSEMFKRIHKSSDVSRDWVAYDLYVYYSKYEHFGVMTHVMQRQGPNKDIEVMIDSLFYLVKGIHICLVYLFFLNATIASERDKIAEIQKEFTKLLAANKN